MTKKVTTITVLIVSIVLVSLYVISSTYAVIISVIENNGASEIINKINIRDILTNDNGEYNNTYYDVKNELDITTSEADILINSIPLNRSLQTVLNSIVSYKLHHKNKMSNNELYELIRNSINEDETINEELKNKVILKSNKYINDISNYMYDIEVKEIEK